MKKNNKKALGAFYKAAKPALQHKWCYVVLTLVGLVLVIADLAFAEVSRILFDSAPNIAHDIAITIIIAFIIIIAIQYIFRFVESYVYSYFNESVIYAMRRETLRKIQRLKMEFYDNNHTSKIANTFFNQIEFVKDFVVDDMRNIIMLPMTFIIIGIYLFTVHPYLAITAIIASILQPLSNLTFKKPFFKALDDLRETDHTVFTTMGEATQGIREIKINQIEDFFDERMRLVQIEGVRNNLRRTIFETLRNIIKDLPTKVGYVTGIAIGIFLMIDNHITPGCLVAFITLLTRIAQPFDGITQTYANYQRALRSANDLLKLIDEPEENYEIGKLVTFPIQEIEFKNVSFSYNVDNTKTVDADSNDVWNELEVDENIKKLAKMGVLEDISFKIKGGTTVALVGPSGGGKSTIIRLLYKFYEPLGGEIMLNNAPLDDYNIEAMRDSMSIVSQDIFIFDGTIRENLTLGRDDITETDIVDALKYSESYDFVMKLPEGLDTYLGERGVSMSQGQKQRLSIARSIIKKAKIIILDEPTSALDVETEHNFQQNLEIWAKGCTKLIIAHRLTTIRDADYVLFLENGTIVEQGSPQELIKIEDGKFKEYWEKQFLFQDEEVAG